MITPPSDQFPIASPAGLPSDRMMGWMRAVSAALGTIAGNGSPEGAVEARQRAIYFREDGSPGEQVYIKTTDGGNTGWVAIG